jgi:tetratricopeptide (TPR) repeat protein
MAIDFDDIWDYNDPKKTEEKFLSILDDVKNGSSLSRFIQLLTQIARTQGMQLKFEEAHKTLDEAENLLEELKPGNEIAMVRYLLERGRAFNSEEKKDKAKEFFKDAFETAKKNNLEFHLIDAAHMMGIAETGEEGLKWNLIATGLIENTSDDRSKKWLGALYNNTGWTYHDMGDYEKALELFRKNVDWHTKKNSGQELRIAKWCVGRTLRSLNKVNEAMIIQTDLLNEIKSKNLPDDGYVNEEIGECLLLRDKNIESKKFFMKAYELLSKDEWLVRNENERLKRLKELGEKLYD